MPLGWRPADVIEKLPVYKIKNVYDFEKYNPRVSSGLLVWSWVQMIVMLLSVSYLFGNIARIGAPGIFWYGAFIFLSIYAYTELLDRNKYAFVWELIKNLLCVFLIWKNHGWFGADNFFSYATVVMIIYLITSTLVVFLFSKDYDKDSNTMAMQLH